jgi:hypothetical protein
MFREFIRDVGPVLAMTIGGAFVLIGLLCIPMVWMSSISCRNIATAMEREYIWGVTTGCLVRATDGQMVPLKNFRKFSEE